MSTNLATVQEAADHYRVTDSTILRWIKSGDLSAYRVGPKLIRVELDSLNVTPLGDAR
jgi:excisionase family DNA binding protein